MGLFNAMGEMVVILSALISGVLSFLLLGCWITDKVCGRPSCEKNPADAQPETGVAEPGKKE